MDYDSEDEEPVQLFTKKIDPSMGAGLESDDIQLELDLAQDDFDPASKKRKPELQGFEFKKRPQTAAPKKDNSQNMASFEPAPAKTKETKKAPKEEDSDDEFGSSSSEEDPQEKINRDRERKLQLLQQQQE